MFLALREIRHEPVRFTLIISVITLVAYLTFFLASLAVGLAHRYRAGIGSWKRPRPWPRTTEPQPPP